MNFRLLSAIILLLAVFFETTAGQNPVSINGFVRNYNAVQLENDQEIIIGRNRLRLNLSKNIESGRIFISNDIQNLYSESADSVFYRPREAYIDFYLDKYDIRAGRQIITWGRTDGGFISDIITPVDLTEFLTQDFNDIKMGVTALNITRYFGSNIAQFILNPVFNSNKIPDDDSRWFPSSLFPANLPVNYIEQDEDPELGNVQMALRYGFRNNLNWNLDVALYYWHFPNPAYRKGIGLANITSLQDLQSPLQFEFREEFLQSFIASYSGFYKLSDQLIFKSESAFYQKKYVDRVPQEIRSLDLENPTLPNLIQAGQVFLTAENGLLRERPWLISMAGLQYQWKGWLFSAQYINEHIFNYNDEILQEHNYDYVTLLTQKNFLRDKLMFTNFARYNFDGNDFWINPEFSYDLFESVNIAGGVQLFGGNKPPAFFGHLSFQFFEESSFTYLKLEGFF